MIASRSAFTSAGSSANVAAGSMPRPPADVRGRFSAGSPLPPAAPFAAPFGRLRPKAPGLLDPFAAFFSSESTIRAFANSSCAVNSSSACFASHS